MTCPLCQGTGYLVALSGAQPCLQCALGRKIAKKPRWRKLRAARERRVMQREEMERRKDLA